MRLLDRSQVAQRFDGKTVAIVGSGPGCAENEPGFVDSHDLVVRVNNYRIVGNTGERTDVFYSFFGSSIKKTVDDLKADGVSLVMSKLPCASLEPYLSPHETAWHRRKGAMIGIDYRPHYRRRQDWWFCDTYVPTVDDFMRAFNALGRHQPTTGFSAIFEIASFNVKSIYLTGFDFFRSGVHNVIDRWRPKNMADPIRHMPELEREWLRENWNSRFSADRRLQIALDTRKTSRSLLPSAGRVTPRQRTLNSLPIT